MQRLICLNRVNYKTHVLNVWGESKTVDQVCEAVTGAIQEAKHVVKRKNAKAEAVAKKSREKHTEQYEKDMQRFRTVNPDLETEMAKRKKGEVLPKSHKETRRKQKQAAKDAAREAKTITITKQDLEAARREKNMAKKKANKKGKKKKATLK